MRVRYAIICSGCCCPRSKAVPRESLWAVSGLCDRFFELYHENSTTKVTLVRGAPKQNCNSGPGALPLFTSHVKSAATGGHCWFAGTVYQLLL